MIKRTLFGVLVSASAVVLMAGPALAHECTNASKDQHNPSAGAQLIFGCHDAILGGTPGGLRMFQNGDFPHGWIAFDIDCDGVADAGTYIVGPNGELPANAQYRGSTAHGVMNICDFFGLPPGCTD